TAGDGIAVGAHCRNDKFLGQVLVRANELIFSGYGFDAKLVDHANIEELGADIGASRRQDDLLYVFGGSPEGGAGGHANGHGSNALIVGFDESRRRELEAVSAKVLEKHVLSQNRLFEDIAQLDAEGKLQAR